MKTSQDQPLLYDCRELVAGSDFAAIITVAGAALVDSDDDDVTILAVHPSGFTGLGASFHAAYADLVRNLREILWDLAHMASSYEDFKELVGKHLGPARKDLLDDWTSAARKIGRARKSDLDLPTATTYPTRGLRIARIRIENQDEEMDGPLAEPVIATKAA